MEYLFIYGTLAPEIVPEEIANAVNRLKFVGVGHVHGKLYDLGKFPGAKLAARTRSKIRGRVYQLPSDETVIKSLDDYEEFKPGDPNNSLYLRKQTPVLLDDGRTILSWIYEYNGDIAYTPVIASGDFSRISA